MKSHLTVADVKRDLPSVKVRIGKKIMWAKVSGRLCLYACVTVNGEWSHALGSAWRDFHFSWEAVTQSVNTGKPLNGNN